MVVIFVPPSVVRIVAVEPRTRAVVCVLTIGVRYDGPHGPTLPKHARDSPPVTRAK